MTLMTTFEWLSSVNILYFNMLSLNCKGDVM